MATPVQITVTVDSSGAVTGFQQIGGAATTMGQEVAVARSRGAEAVAALTAQYEKEQATIAAVNARIKENMAAQTAAAVAAEAAAKANNKDLQDAEKAAAKAAKEFQGMSSRQMEASVSGRLLEQTLGLQNRAINQVIARSSFLGPILANLFPLSIFASVIPMFVRIGEEIVHAAQAAGGYTEAIKQAYDETVKASHQALVDPKSLDVSRQHIASMIDELKLIETQKTKLQADIARPVPGGGDSRDVAVMRAKAQSALNAAVAEEERIRKNIEETETNQHKLLKALGEAQGAADAKMREVGLTGAALAAQKYKDAQLTINTNGKLSQEDPQVTAQKLRDAQATYLNESINMKRSEAMETMKLQDQVTENALTGIAKIKQEESDHIKETLAEDVIKMGRSAAEVQKTAEYQAQIAKIHQDAANKITAYNVQQDERVRSLQDEAIKSALTGDAAILQSGQKRKEAEGELQAKGLIDDAHYNAAIVAINKDTNNKIQGADQKTREQSAADLAQRTVFIQKETEDQRDALSAAALASVPPWQHAYQQIAVESEKRLRAIDEEERKALLQYSDDESARTQITATENAKRQQVYAETNERVHAENLRLTEQLGGELQSVFDDMTSGNIGKRILANMEKLFFQIVAQWILSLQIMKSAAGSIFGSIVFGPGSTGAGVFGGGGGGGSSILGSIFGGGSSGPQSGTISQTGGIFSGSSTLGSGGGFSLPGLTPGGGLTSAIAGTAATSSSGLLPSASNALTTATMADALGGGGGALGGGVTGSAGKSGLASFFSAGNLTSLAGFGLGAVGSAFGGKSGQVGGLLMGLLMSGKLAPVLSSMFGAIGLGATGAIAGGLTGGLIGFGVGSSHGGLLGSLAGAGSGALTGFLVGGPVGAIVGGIIGLLGGIFGGIFGGSKRKKQANALADNTLLPGISSISTGFDGFQVDSSSAIQQLEQLRTDAQKQLSALKSQGNDVFKSKVNPAIDAAEAHIRDTQAERDRRSAQVFGPPQFDTGGIFRVNGGRHGLAILEDGEAVIKPGPSKQNLAAIAHMNAGGSVGGLSIGNLNITPRTLDRAYVMSNQFRKDLLDALARARQEGELVGGF